MGLPAFSSIAKRDSRIDVVRAIALLSIFINHIPGTIYEWITHKHFGFSDCTEIFVLLSGMAVGLAYGHHFQASKRLHTSYKLIKRALQLYNAHILTGLISLGLFLAFGLLCHRPSLLSVNNIEPIIQNPAAALLGFITLGHQLGYNNILPLYMVLMAASPLFLGLYQKSPSFLFIASLATYILSAIFYLAPPTYPVAGVWFLNPLSWQFLFVIGLIASLQQQKEQRLPYHPALLFAALGYLLVSLLWVRLNWWSINLHFEPLGHLTTFNKTFLGLPRLLHILALSYCVAIIKPLNQLFALSPQSMLATLGRHSLPVFAFGTILSQLGQILKKIIGFNSIEDGVFIIICIGLQVLLAFGIEWIGMLEASRKKHASAPHQRFTKNHPAQI
ncbi:OpgC family protein [Bartonella sp. DGB2]|uniref:OpgC family protein n=1 Tax=Bartonella sp. DGB2 TaxID=3388426 RepID=UPI00398F93FF